MIAFRRTAYWKTIGDICKRSQSSHLPGIEVDAEADLGYYKVNLNLEKLRLSLSELLGRAEMGELR